MVDTEWQKAVYSALALEGRVHLRVGPQMPVVGKTLPRADLALLPADARRFAKELLEAADMAEKQA